jgi:hypothetical protein
MTQLTSTWSKAIVQLPQISEDRSLITHLAGRLIQITLALYLLPALLAVLVVGGVGIFAIKFSQIVAKSIKASGH